MQNQPFLHYFVMLDTEKGSVKLLENGFVLRSFLSD